MEFHVAEGEANLGAVGTPADRRMTPSSLGKTRLAGKSISVRSSPQADVGSSREALPWW